MSRRHVVALGLCARAEAGGYDQPVPSDERVQFEHPRRVGGEVAQLVPMLVLHSLP